MLMPTTARVLSTVEMLISYAVKAPSSHNSQPWRFVVDKTSRVLLYADHTRQLPVGDATGRELVMSCGAALENLVVAARAFGFEADVHVLPSAADPGLLARVDLCAGDWPGDEDSLLFDAIDRRRTSREPFTPAPIPASVAQALESAAALRGSIFVPLHSGVVRRRFRDLVEAGDRRLFADASWRSELASWIRTPRHDGDGMRFGRIPAPLARVVVRSADLGGRVAATDRDLVDGAPLVALIATAADDPASWLAAGRALERVLLLAERHGVRAGFLNQPCQLADLRLQLAALVPGAGHPQVALRLGYPAGPLRATPRRAVDEVVTEGVACPPACTTRPDAFPA